MPLVGPHPEERPTGRVSKDEPRQGIGHNSAFPQRDSAQGLHYHVPPEFRGRRECRVQAAPMARLQRKKQAAVTTGSAGTTGIPCAMVLRLIRDLPGVRASLATVVSREAPAKLDPSVGGSGPHDFAVRVRAARLAAPIRPPLPAANVRGDCAYAPLTAAGWRQDKHIFLKNGR
jgi:hypothetical protein